MPNRLALVANPESDDFRVALGAPDDLKLEKTKYLPQQGCDVAWRPDGAELAVVRAGVPCAGRIVRVRLSDSRTLRTIVRLGQHPSWQPLDLTPGPGP